MTVAICIAAGLAVAVAVLVIGLRRMKAERDELKGREEFLQRTVAAHTEYAADKEEINEWKEEQYALSEADASSVIADIVAANNRLSKPRQGGDNPAGETAKADD